MTEVDLGELTRRLGRRWITELAAMDDWGHAAWIPDLAGLILAAPAGLLSPIVRSYLDHRPAGCEVDPSLAWSLESVVEHAVLAAANTWTLDGETMPLELLADLRVLAELAELPAELRQCCADLLIDDTVARAQLTQAQAQAEARIELRCGCAVCLRAVRDGTGAGCQAAAERGERDDGRDP